MDDSIPRLLDRGGEGAEHQELGLSRLAGGRSCLRRTSDQHSHSYDANNQQVKNRSLVHDFFSSMANRIWMKSLLRNIRLAALDLACYKGLVPAYLLSLLCLPPFRALFKRLNNGRGRYGYLVNINPQGIGQSIGHRRGNGDNSVFSQAPRAVRPVYVFGFNEENL